MTPRTPAVFLKELYHLGQKESESISHLKEGFGLIQKGFRLRNILSRKHRLLLMENEKQLGQNPGPKGQNLGPQRITPRVQDQELLKELATCAQLDAVSLWNIDCSVPRFAPL